MTRTRRVLLLALAALLLVSGFGCAPAPTTPPAEEIGGVSVMGLWGSTEVESFNKVVDGWEGDTGGSMDFEGTRDLSAILRARTAGGNPPDLAVLPNPALLKEFAAAGDLIALDDVLDMDQLRQDYGETWIEQASVDGKVYGVFVKAATKSTVWYDPKEFAANEWTTPTSWDEMIKLSNDMKAADKAPWSIALEGGAASGWPGTDWIQEIMLAQSGPEAYDRWVAHEIPWTDPAVKSAWEKFGEVANTEGFVPGGADAMVSTNFEDGSYLPYEDPPKANQYFLGAFTQGFIAAQFPDLKPVEDYDFYDFPAVDPQYQGAATGGADVLVMFKNTASSKSLMNYLAQGDSWGPWAEAGGFTTPNKSFDASAYPDPLAAKAAAQLTDSQIFRFDADDLMPAEVQTAYWKGILEYVQNPDQLDKILADIEAVAAEAYAQQ